MNPVVVHPRSQVTNEAHDTQRYLRAIVEQATTPFERLGEDYVQGQSMDPMRYTTYLQHWAYNLSSEGKHEKLKRFIDFADLSEADVQQMLAPAQLTPGATLPTWTTILEAVITADYSPEWEHFPLDPANPLPFEALLLPFIRVFRERLQAATGQTYTGLSHKAHLGIEQFLLKRLGDCIEKVLFTGFERFLKEHLGEEGPDGKEKNLPDDHYYQLFTDNLSKDHLRTFFSHYPMLARIMSNMLHQFIEAFTRFIHRLDADRNKFRDHFAFSADPGQVASLNLGISDPHKGGEGVMILTFASGDKLVYKPRCVKIGLAYNTLCQWINERIEPQIKVLQILEGEEYGWIEFVPKDDCQDQAAIERYYERAGILLGITYLLDSTDFHAENLIASGEHPVLVDHETLLQPQLKRQSNATSMAEARADSVLRSALLPMYIRTAEVKNDSMSGLGSIEEGAIQVWFNQCIHPNTDRMQVVRQQKSYEVTSNLPTCANTIQRLPQYQAQFEKGFTRIYQLCLSERELLLSAESPLHHFEHIQLRFLFRSTNVYATILRNLLKPEFLRDANLYGFRIELLARAFLTQSDAPAFWPILHEERRAMINRDIPCFDVDSNADSLRAGKEALVESYFRSSCTEYVQRKLRQMGPEDLDIQMELIQKSIQGELNQ